MVLNLENVAAACEHARALRAHDAAAHGRYTFMLHSVAKLG